MREYYEILGVNEGASEEEITAKYEALKKKYQSERFMEGEVGNNAAKMLTKIEVAYSEIMQEIKETSNDSQPTSYEEIEELIRKNDISGAQAKLDDILNRDAEWHYLQSVVFYKKNWLNESKKQLEIALQLDANNLKYKTAYDRLKAKTDYSREFRSGNGSEHHQATNQNVNDRQMGGSDCGSFCDCCASWCCMNMLCNSCCR